jgi:hypothetical protein
MPSRRKSKLFPATDLISTSLLESSCLSWMSRWEKGDYPFCPENPTLSPREPGAVSLLWIACNSPFDSSVRELPLYWAENRQRRLYRRPP